MGIKAPYPPLPLPPKGPCDVGFGLGLKMPWALEDSQVFWMVLMQKNGFRFLALGQT